MTISSWSRLLVGCFVVTLVAPVLACKVPVFRYALERWASDKYRIVAVTDGAPSEAASEAIRRLQEVADMSINAEVEVIDLSKLTEGELWSIEGLEDTEDVPILQVFYPEKSGKRKMCWSGELIARNIDRWIDSPLRTAIAHDLVTGVSATWIFAEGPDEEKNAAMLGRLQQALKTAADQISVPEGVIRREDAARVMAEDPSASMDDILRSDIPLRIEFSVHRLHNDDPAESALSAMLRGGEDQIQPPFVCPVFGRGRMAEPLIAESFSEGAVVSACEYMVGECSCSVKALSPGIDMLLNIDWQDKLGNDIVMVNSPAPETPTVLAVPPGNTEAPQFDGANTDSRTWTWQWIAIGLFSAAVCACIRKGVMMISARKDADDRDHHL